MTCARWDNSDYVLAVIDFDDAHKKGPDDSGPFLCELPISDAAPAD